MAVMAVIRILIINPNSSQLMTDALRDPVETLGYNNVFFSAPLPRNMYILSCFSSTQ